MRRDAASGRRIVRIRRRLMSGKEFNGTYLAFKRR
jgi:hypothetical protein